jgi:hypothetical protein
VPLIWGTLIKRAPAWAGWTTVLAGFTSSLLISKFMTGAWIAKMTGWTALSKRENSDWELLAGVLVNTLVCSAWFLASCFWSKRRPAAEVERVEKFFEQMKTPVNFEKEIGAGNDASQQRTLGLLCLIYGGGISLLILIPNSAGGRLGMIFCAGSILLIGVALYLASRVRSKNSPQLPAVPRQQTSVELQRVNTEP